MNTLVRVVLKRPPITALRRFQRIPIHSQIPSLPTLISPPITSHFFGTCQPRHRQTHFPPTSPELSPKEDKSSKPEPSLTKPNSQEYRKSLAERDADHLAKMREAMGGADHSNVEMEDGVPDRGMKRNVRENMFRII